MVSLQCKLVECFKKRSTSNGSHPRHNLTSRIECRIGCFTPWLAHHTCKLIAYLEKQTPGSRNTNFTKSTYLDSSSFGALCRSCAAVRGRREGDMPHDILSSNKDRNPNPRRDSGWILKRMSDQYRIGLHRGKLRHVTAACMRFARGRPWRL
jgi:hypothetical protein